MDELEKKAEIELKTKNNWENYKSFELLRKLNWLYLYGADDTKMQFIALKCGLIKYEMFLRRKNISKKWVIFGIEW